MKLFPIVATVILFAAACEQPAKQTPLLPPKPVKVKPVHTTVNEISSGLSKWFDSMTVVYNTTARNPLVRAAMSDRALKEEWLFDQELKTDTADYYVYQVGHDLTDKDGKRFITDSWIYVDTLKRRFYELTPENTLVDQEAVKQ